MYLLLDEFPGQQQTIHYQSDYDRDDFLPIHDHTPLTLEKSNVLCLGPTGVGKTLMIRFGAIKSYGLRRRRVNSNTEPLLGCLRCLFQCKMK